ncbi:ATP-binding protein [Aquimarina sp. 2201CG14-23]|uniref:ATP-binding protein n=1 Tax=Aquimarina mycalae TaxID=3040073 RepID=UPI002477F011|nr:ATP-binding protein [Aquimarina sp. 2201CG14-23]MDH7446649.1 ATP-binding protein [Aquimarina sp. 2201CG14-23]
MAKHKIVITGGPSTGKTSIIKRLEEEGYFCFPEFIRSITQEVKNSDDTLQIVSNPIATVSDPYDFNTQLMKGRINQYKDSRADDKEIAFYDRGIPDVLAYMDLFNQTYDTPFIEACQNYKYDQVFLLPPWKEIYTSDEERYESFEEAQQIHKHLLETYSKFGYNCIEVPFGNVKERSTFILQHVI